MKKKTAVKTPPKTNSPEINALASELATCRTQEQNGMNQITQFVIAAWTILMAVFAFGALSETELSFATQLLLYWVTITILCVLGASIISAGMTAIIRHHHMINLEDMISDAISKHYDDKTNEMQRLLLWISLSTAVNTLNYRNVKKNKTTIYFISNAIEIIALVISGFLFICIQLKKLINVLKLEFPQRPIPILTYCEIFIPLAILLGIVLYGIKTYAYLTQNSRSYYDKAKSIGIEKWQKRKETETATNGIHALTPQNTNDQSQASFTKTLMNIIIYFLYPRIKDIQKAVFLILGYIFGWLLMINYDGIGFYSFDFGKLMLTLFITEALIYQARYQWNDLRGLNEDVKEKKKAVGKSVGFPKLLKSKHYSFLVTISMLIIFIKLYYAFFILIPYYGDQQYLMSGVNIMIILLAALYEFARSRQKGGKAVLILVGLGYSLRFTIGLLAAYPNLLTYFKLDIILEFLHNIFKAVRELILNIFSIGSISQPQEHMGIFLLLIVLSLAIYGMSFIAVGWVLSLCDILEKSEKSNETVELRPHYIILAGIWLRSTGKPINIKKHSNVDAEEITLLSKEKVKALRNKKDIKGNSHIYPLILCDNKINWWNATLTISISLLSAAQFFINSSTWLIPITIIPVVLSVVCSCYPYTTIEYDKVDGSGISWHFKKNLRVLSAYLLNSGYCVLIFSLVRLTFQKNNSGFLYIFLAFLQFFYFILYCSFRNSNYNELYNFLPNVLNWIKLHIIYILIGKNTLDFLKSDKRKTAK